MAEKLTNFCEPGYIKWMKTSIVFPYSKPGVSANFYSAVIYNDFLISLLYA